jgi:cysteine-rich repeat protein
VQAGVETCDDGNQANTDACAMCKPAVCGDGFVRAGVETCDDANMVNTDGCVACKAAVCGDGFIQAGVEQCDDGNAASNDGCSSVCQIEGVCTLNPAVMNLPVVVHPSNYYAEIAFDAQCNILVATAFSGGLVRINKNNGAVTTLVANFGGTPSANGVVFRPADGRIYVSTDSPSRLYSTDTINAPVLHVNFPSTANALAIAPPSFGPYGGQIIAAMFSGALVAINPANNSQTTIGTLGGGLLDDLAFAPNGTLYVTDNNTGRVLSVTSGGVFTQLIAGLSSPDGIAVDTDGSRLFVMHYPNGARLDRVSLPGAVLTAGNAVNIDGGWYTTGVIADAADNVFYKSSNGQATVAFVKVP